MRLKKETEKDHKRRHRTPAPSDSFLLEPAKNDKNVCSSLTEHSVCLAHIRKHVKRQGDGRHVKHLDGGGTKTFYRQRRHKKVRGSRVESSRAPKRRQGILCQIYLGDRLSFFRMLRWKSEGAKHTAIFMGVIWFSSTEEVTSLRKQSRVCSTSRFSSDISMMAAWTACSLWSFGTSAHLRQCSMLLGALTTCCCYYYIKECIHTLVDVQEGLAQLAGEQGLG